MNTTIGTLLIDVSLVDDVLTIKATTDLVNQLERLLQLSLWQSVSIMAIHPLHNYKREERFLKVSNNDTHCC